MLHRNDSDYLASTTQYNHNTNTKHILPCKTHGNARAAVIYNRQSTAQRQEAAQSQHNMNFSSTTTQQQQLSCWLQRNGRDYLQQHNTTTTQIRSTYYHAAHGNARAAELCNSQSNPTQRQGRRHMQHNTTRSKKTPHRSAATLGDNTTYYSFYNTPHAPFGRNYNRAIELSSNNATPVQYTKYYSFHNTSSSAAAQS